MPNFASGHVVTNTEFNALTPVGTVFPFAGSSAPTSWLLCDGSAVSRSTYADLFAVIGTTYGTGDGSTTFNVPDCQGRMVVGKGTHADVDALNDHDGISLGSRTPTHSHQTTVPNSGAAGGSGTGSPPNVGTPGTYTSTSTVIPYITLNYIIRT